MNIYTVSPFLPLVVLVQHNFAYIVWITANCGKFLKRREYQKQQLELDMEQWTASKLGKEYIKAVYCHPAYLTYMQSTPYEMISWKNHKLESRLLGGPFLFLFLPSWNGDQMAEVRATTVRLWKNKSMEFQLSQGPKLFES